MGYKETRAQRARRHACESMWDRTDHIHLLGGQTSFSTPNREEFIKKVQQIMDSGRISPDSLDIITDLLCLAWNIGHGNTGDLNIDLGLE